VNCYSFVDYVCCCSSIISIYLWPSVNVAYIVLRNDCRNMENPLKMPEKDRIQRLRKKNTKSVLIRLFFIGDLLARM